MVSQGIAYATPPIGTRRWRKPVPLWVDSAWCDEHQTQEAFHFGSKCYQLNPYTKQYEGSEDCLFLNVWTPSLDSTSITVMKEKSFVTKNSFRELCDSRNNKIIYFICTTHDNGESCNADK
ncbi:COesterase domain-containing protein [Caerostris extrusa]|uniref:COesterase domain-containing protein n=1 Tax=Caerostris extrusa TaxID=172846 RepID=A0AAV4N366_CAEEX|nr:COesterase domain-containing protein [Caerostris extrusa]